MGSIKAVTEKQVAATTMHWHTFEMEWSVQCFAEVIKYSPRLEEKFPYFTSELGHFWKLSVQSTKVYGRGAELYKFRLSCNPNEGHILTKCSIQVKDRKTGTLYSPADATEEIAYFEKRESITSDSFVTVWEVDSADFNFEILRQNDLTSHDGTLTTVWTVKTLQLQTSLPTLLVNANVCDIVNQFQLNRDLFPDIKLVTRRQQFNAHKVVLAGRSSVFRAMFSSNMIETQNDQVDMSQHRPTAVEIMLNYIYTGKYVQLYAKEVLQLANMYDIAGLKSAAEAELIQNLQPESAAKCMHYGDLFQCPRLKAAAVAYIKRNKYLVSENEAHKNYLDLHSDLLKEISNIIISQDT